MNRCTRNRTRTALAALLAGALLILSPLASAQALVREAPRDVKPGRIVVTQPPEITLDGKPDRLSPGSRVRNTNNMLMLSGSLVGQNLPVVYRRDSAGLVHEAWILTEAEYSKLGGPGSDGEGARRFAELLNLIFGARK